jgi:putative peptidoglycan lipid II flippase
MNEPYDGEGGREPGDQFPPLPEQPFAAPDPYRQDSYAHDPYRQQGPTEQDPVGEELYDRAVHPQSYAEPQAQYGQSSYDQPAQGQQPHGQHAYDQQAHGQQPYQQPTHGQQPHGQQAYDQQHPHGQQPYQQPTHGQQPYQQPHGQQGEQHPHGQQPDGQQAYDQQQAHGQQTYQQAHGQPPHGQQSDQQAHGQQGYWQQPYAEQTLWQQPYWEQPYGEQGYWQQPYAEQTLWQQPYAEQTYWQQQQSPYAGVEDLSGRPIAEQFDTGVWATLFRDQRPQAAPAPAPPTEHVPTAAPVPAPRSEGGRASVLMKSSAVMAAGTIVSRVTGFARNLVVAAAIGLGGLNDGYQVANTLPTMIYILVGGGALNAVFIPQLVRSMKEDEDGGEAYANRLLTLVVVGLAGITTVMVLGAPLLVRLMYHASDATSMQVAVSFTRYCLPTVFFMGVHVVLGQILNARGKFGAMMWTPVLNNIVIIATFGAFIWVFGAAGSSGVNTSTITPAGVQLLGVGTLLGLTVQALSMIPYLREAGLRIRPRFDWRGHGLGHAAKLAKWTFLFVLANQIGLTVVIQLATWAGSVADSQGYQGTGITAYNYALQLWQMPQAIVTVSVMTAILPRISRAAADGDAAAVRDDLSYGLRTSAVAIVPSAFAFLTLGVPMSTFMYASAGQSAAAVGYVLMGFALGLIPYSVCYVVLRGFYAYEDTRTPFYNTVIVAVVNAVASSICFVVLPARWAVVGMAASYGLAYTIGVGVAVKRLRIRLGGDLDGKRIVRTYTRLIGASVPASLAAGAIVYGISQVMGTGAVASLLSVVLGGAILLGVFFLAAKRMRIEEMTAMVGMLRGRLGR